MVVNIASGLFLIGGTIAAVAMITNPLAPVIMAAVFAFAMVCSLFNRKYDTFKYDSPGSTNSSFFGASDGEASKSYSFSLFCVRGKIIFTDKKSWALCIIGMTSVAVTTGLGSMGTIPAIFAGIALFSAIYRVANSYYNNKAKNKGNNKAQTPLCVSVSVLGDGSLTLAPALPSSGHI